jgi:hypothetical protein
MINYSTVELEVKMPTEAMVFDGDSLYARLQELEDQRDDKGKLYPLAPLLFIVILAKLVGQNQLINLFKKCLDTFVETTNIVKGGQSEPLKFVPNFSPSQISSVLLHLTLNMCR